ncbi:MAG: prepilin-type N-terminal cleavage/methylation domain-containing protein [Prochlorococcus sp.]
MVNSLYSLLSFPPPGLGASPTAWQQANRSSPDSGFRVVELMIVIVVIAILSAVAISSVVFMNR